jgi:hypothetical protein
LQIYTRKDYKIAILGKIFLIFFPDYLMKNKEKSYTFATLKDVEMKNKV